MTTREFIDKNFRVESTRDRHCSSVFADRDGNIYSYGYHYPLLFVVDNINFRNTRGYSATTAKHISWTYGQGAIDVELDHMATEVINKSYYSDEDKLTHIERCLNDMRQELEDEMATKKRHDTDVYRRLEFRLLRVKNDINKLEMYKRG